MYFSPFAKQNQAEVWTRFQSLLKSFSSDMMVLNESTYSMPCVRCAFGNVFTVVGRSGIKQLVKPIHKPQNLIVRIEGRVCFANSVYLGFRTCWRSEDWPTVTKGISDIGLRREQALENEIKNDASNMEKGTRTHT